MDSINIILTDITYYFSRKKALLVAIIFTIAAIFVSCMLISNAKASKIEREKSMTSIQVKQGDTLWTIAEKYADKSEWGEYDDYIDEVKKINGIKGNTIHAGGYIVIPYYEE